MSHLHRTATRLVRAGVATIAGMALAAGSFLGVAAATAPPASAALLPAVQTSFITFTATSEPVKVVDVARKRYVCETVAHGHLSTTSLVGLVPLRIPLNSQQVTITDAYGSHTVTTNHTGDFVYAVHTELHLFPEPQCSAAGIVAAGSPSAHFKGLLSPVVLGAASARLSFPTS